MIPRDTDRSESTLPAAMFAIGDGAPAPAPSLESSSPAQIIERAADAAREMLGMDMAYVADTRDGEQDYRYMTGDGKSFGAAVGEPVSLDGTYCQMLLDGRLDHVVRDAGLDPRVSGLAITARAGIGSYIGVPIVLSDGSAYGTFCCLSHAPNHDLRERDVQFMRVLGRLIADQLRRAELDRERHEAALTSGSVNALLAALEARDGYTGQHSFAVLELAVRVGRSLGLAREQLRDLECAALLHDIGKIGVPDAVLRKPGPLDPEEWQEMHRHPVIGERIVAAMPVLAHLAPVIRAEHERWDGCGYPDGLAGESIPLLSRIVFACDAYHAMTSDRPYRRALPADEAARELRNGAGSQFCPRVAAAIGEFVGPGRIDDPATASTQ